MNVPYGRPLPAPPYDRYEPGPGMPFLVHNAYNNAPRSSADIYAMPMQFAPGMPFPPPGFGGPPPGYASRIALKRFCPDHVLHDTGSSLHSKIAILKALLYFVHSPCIIMLSASLTWDRDALNPDTCCQHNVGGVRAGRKLDCHG